MDAQQESSSTGSDVTNFAVGDKWIGSVAVVSATGAVDMLTAPQLAQSIRTSLGKQPKV